jgi:hypothetical protein
MGALAGCPRTAPRGRPARPLVSCRRRARGLSLTSHCRPGGPRAVRNMMRAARLVRARARAQPSCLGSAAESERDDTFAAAAAILCAGRREVELEFPDGGRAVVACHDAESPSVLAELVAYRE